MATSAQQATFAAQKGKNWADPTDPSFGTDGYIGRDEYSQYQSAAGGAPSSPPPSPTPGAPAPVTTQQQVQNTTAPVGGSITPGTNTTVGQSYQQALVNKLNPAAVSLESPSVAPAIQASRLATQRGMESTRNLLAERAAATGTNLSGGFESQLLGAEQGANAAQSAYEGNLLRDAQQEQDLNTRTAMAQAGGLLSGNAGLTQQQSLAELDAALRREALQQQGALGQSDIALRRALGEGGLNLSLLGLLQGGDQFTRQLGQNASQFGASLDQSGLLSLLGLL